MHIPAAVCFKEMGEYENQEEGHLVFKKKKRKNGAKGNRRSAWVLKRQKESDIEMKNLSEISSVSTHSDTCSGVCVKN